MLLLAIFLSFCSQFCEFCSQFVNFSSFFHQNSTIFMSFKEVRKVRARTPQNPHISITNANFFGKKYFSNEEYSRGGISSIGRCIFLISNRYQDKRARTKKRGI